MHTLFEAYSGFCKTSETEVSFPYLHVFLFEKPTVIYFAEIFQVSSLEVSVNTTKKESYVLVFCRSSI